MEVSSKEMYFTVDDEVTKLGNITKKCEASDVAGSKNDMRDFVKQVKNGFAKASENGEKSVRKVLLRREVGER